MIPLSLRQFASAVGATPKWVLNAAARVGRPFEYTDTDARWLRLARSLNRDLRIPLRTAAALAVRALEGEGGPLEPWRAVGRECGESLEPPRPAPGGAASRRGELAHVHANSGRRARRAGQVVSLMEVHAEGLRLTIDLERHRATFAAALAAAMAFETPKRRGRKCPSPRNFGAAIGRARRRGIEVGLLRARLRRPPAARLAPPSVHTPGTVDLEGILTCLQSHGVRVVVTGEAAEVMQGAASPAGVDPVPLVGPLELCYDGSAANLAALADALRDLEAGPRLELPGQGPVAEVARGEPPAPGMDTLASAPALALATRCGPLNMRRELPGLGDFAEARRCATVMGVLGADVPVLELPALCRVRRAIGSRQDIERLTMLETVLALPALEARHRDAALRRTQWTRRDP